MTSTTWDFAAGFAHLEDVQILVMSGSDQQWISATPDGARNTALSALFVAESLVYAVGDKPIPSDPSFPMALLVAISPPNAAMPLASNGTPITLGDGLDFLPAAARSWPSGGPFTREQAVAIYQYAMRRAVRELIRESVPFDPTAKPQIDDNNQDPNPSIHVPTGPGLGAVEVLRGGLDGHMGAVPVGVLVLLGVVGVAAMAAAAWTAVESVKPLTAMSVQKAAIAAQLAFDSQIAVAQIKAGQPVTVSKLAETYASAEKTESIAVPVATAAVGLVAGGLALWGWNKRRKGAGKPAEMVK